MVNAGAARWRRCTLVAGLLQRLRNMRTLAADLDIANAQNSMEQGYVSL